MSVTIINFRKKCAPVLLLALSTFARAQPPLPELGVEPISGGTVFTVKNIGSQPLTACLLELVGYPGSSFVLIEDDITSPVAPGVEKHIPSTNMIPGAAPTYMKLQAAIYLDGSSSGDPQKVAQIIEHRRLMLEATRDAIHRLETAKSASTPKDAVIADLKQWDASIAEPVHKYRFRPKELNQTDTKALITDIEAKVEAHSIDDALSGLRSSEQAMAASKPAL